jgi:hypothetical protein
MEAANLTGLAVNERQNGILMRMAALAALGALDATDIGLINLNASGA